MSYVKRADSLGNAGKFTVPFIHLLDTVRLPFCRFTKNIMLKSGGKEHTVFHARNSSRGNTVFHIFKAVEIGFLFRI